MSSSGAMITLPFKYEWSENFKKFYFDKTIESPVFGPKNFDMIKFKWRLLQKGFENEIFLILVSSMDTTINLKYKIILNHTSIKNPKEFQKHEYNELSVGKECFIGCCDVGRIKSIQCEFELNFPSKFEPQLETLLKDFNSLRSKSRFTDVTFVVGEKEFPANKIILSARSPVFEVMFSRAEFVENQQNRVDITDIDEKVFGAMIDFIYTAQVKQLDEIVPELLVAAHKYEMKSLVQLCAQSMMKSISIENAVNYLLHANMYSLAELKSRALDFINKNAGKITKSEDWVKYVKSDNALLAELYLAFADKQPQT